MEAVITIDRQNNEAEGGLREKEKNHVEDREDSQL
jgi:hypothetical protein